MMQKKRTSLAKVSQPILRDVYLRERVFKILDRARAKPVIWISGPPGCGKTILVTSYLERHGHPSLWYQIDEGDADPATFFYYLGLAAKEAAPRKRKPLPLLTPEYLPGLPTFTLRYFENLYGRLKAPCFFVFDNYQEVSLESPFHEVMRQGLSNIPQGINVIVISRAEPPPVFIRLRANNQMAEITWNELRLTLEESESIVRLQTKKTLSDEAVEHLHAVTDGWLAGLMLMLKAAQKERVDPRELGKVPLEQIFDYFAGELFDRIDLEAQDFLLKTAFLPKMTAGMAEALTGFDFASRILSYLHRNHCFTLRHLQSTPTYEYHPLFRDFLLSRAKEKFATKIFADTCRRAAILLEKAGQSEAAIELLCDLGDWDEAVPLILKHAPGLLAQGRNRPLAKWLGALPKEMVENTPWLLYWTGASHFPSDLSKSRHYFEQAYEEFKKQDEAAGVFLAWSGVVDSIWLESQDFTQFDRWIQELEAFMRVCPAFPSPEIEARVASSMLTALVFRQPQHPDVETWSERVLSLPEDKVGTGAKLMTLLELVNHHSRLGNIGKMELANEMVEQLSRDRDFSTFDQILAGVLKAQRCSVMGFYEEGLDSISRGLEISRTSGLYVFVLTLLGLRALFALELNDLELAKRTIEEMATSLHSAAPFEKALYHFLKTRESLIRKDHPLTTHHADLALKQVDHVGSASNMAATRLLKAQVMHELGKREEADDLLADALSIARQINSKFFEFNAVMIRAQFAFDRGEEASGVTFLREALTMGKEQRYLNNIVDQPSVTAALCARALEAGIEVEYVQHIIRKRQLIPDTPPVHLENWPWAVQVHTLGRFELMLDGIHFESSRKAQKKPLELLKVLTSFGEGREVTRDQLSDILWPEAEGDKAQRAFDTTLHRLRQLLANDKALILREGRLILDPRYCWVDSVAFERILEQADNAAEQGDRDKAVQLLEKAINLYRGPYLGGNTEMPWAISYTERLRSRFLRAIQTLGAYLEEANELDKAVACLERAIEVDDLAEVFYQRLMLCLKKLGRRSDALAVYQRCRKTLAACLELEPTRETEVIYKSLLSG